MRWPAAARVGLVALALAAVTVTVSGSAAAGPGGPPSAEPTAGSFRSVRSYDEVAEPVRLRIPAAGVDTPLERLGRAPDGSVEVPTAYEVAGWFADGPRPGQAGPAVVLGHVDSRVGPGVFSGLRRLPPGAEVVVDRADGSTAAFRVTGTVQAPKTAFPTDLVYGATLEPALRLVTCGGSFDQARRSYRDNVIVYADPVD